MSEPKLKEVKVADLKTKIKKTNEILRTTKNPREFKQNKAYLKRLERELRVWATK